MTAPSSAKTTKTADNSAKVHSLSIPGLSSPELVGNVTLDSPTHLKLKCGLQRDSGGQQISNVTWKHGEEEVSNERYTYNTTDSEWSTTLDLFVENASGAGNYTCVFLSTPETKATFFITVPGVHGGGKTLVTYNGDSVVLKCDSTNNYKPLQWVWYKINETEQVLLNFSADSSKYKESSEEANETKLHIADLSESDGGAYICKAVYKIGESEEHLHLKVLSLMAPLKVFFAIAAEVVVLVTIILSYEFISKRNQKNEDDEVKENEQMTHLKSEENSTSESSNTRQRKA
ncbi:embigin isoform X2 [Hyperolius riggenbachi]